MKVLTTDCETTGLPAKGSTWERDYKDYPYIVSLAYKIDATETKYFIINQEGRLIPPEATAIHGITNEMAAASPHKLIDALPITTKMTLMSLINALSNFSNLGSSRSRR